VSGLTIAFDTATPDTAVAVCDGAEALAERLTGPDGNGRPVHGTALLPLIDELVAGAGGWDAIGSIAVGIGPGSFTGTRIGVSTARALAQARGLPVAGVPSTATLAAGIPAADGRHRLAAIDARRGELFVALLAPDGERAGDPAVLAPEAVSGLFQGLGSPLTAGDGAVRFRDELELGGADVLADGDPAHRISARLVSALAPVYGHGAGDPEDVKPLYLRRPDAERWRERNRGNR
jgi:tRNA threonylcarbamoyladenosine biosynthesis protein TsaB